MKKAFALLTIPAILAYFAPLALAQKPSPAGGKYLDFNGKDNCAILETGKLVDAKLKAITVEAWIYLRDFPGRQENWIIAAKPDCFELSIEGEAFDDNAPFQYSIMIYKQGGKSKIGILGQIKHLNKWRHISGSFDGTQMNRLSFDGLIERGGVFPRNLANTDLPCYIGGIEGREGSYFDGCAKTKSCVGVCIDEVRISSVVRYKNSFKPPEKLFKADGKTLALWHFNGNDETIFKDSSGNENTLIGKGIRFPVKPQDKLSTIWAKIKN